MIFTVLLILLPVAALIGMYSYFVIRRLIRFYIGRKNRLITVVNVVLAIAVGLSCCIMTSTAAVIMLHVVLIFALCDLAAVIIRRVRKRTKKDPAKVYTLFSKIYRCGVVPVLIAALIVGFGFYNMAHPVKTQYEIKSDKVTQDHTVAFISDTHFGTIQNPQALKTAADEISKIEPDVLILGGDIVEDNTSNGDMKRAFEILGGIKTKYGVYYIFGNHDLQNYSANKHYTSQELTDAITSNGIKILADEAVEIGNDMVLAGRNDSGFGMGQTVERQPVDEILAGVDKDKFILVADHRPTDIDSDSKAGVDLVLSGHTHAGQIFPVGAVQSLFGLYIYGEYEVENTKLIVSSGFAGWGYPMRTEKRSEYVIVNIGNNS